MRKFLVKQEWCNNCVVRIDDSGLLLRNNVIYSLEKKSESMSQHDNNVSCVNSLRFDLSLNIRKPDASPADTIKKCVFVTIKTVVLQSHQFNFITLNVFVHFGPSLHLAKCCFVLQNMNLWYKMTQMSVLKATTFRQSSDSVHFIKHNWPQPLNDKNIFSIFILCHFKQTNKLFSLPYICAVAYFNPSISFLFEISLVNYILHTYNNLYLPVSFLYIFILC